MKRTLSLLALLLATAAVPAAAQSAARPLQIGQTVTSELDASDGKLEEGSYYETWTFQARAGQKLVISMGGDFDTYLVLGYMDGGEFRQIIDGDDSLWSTDSTIDFDVRNDGTYVIRARSFAEDETGRYTLVVFDGA